MGSNQYRVIMSVFIIVSLFVVGGCSKQLSFDELIDADMNDLSLYTHSSNSMNYEISILSKFELSDSGFYDTIKFEVFIDTSYQYEDGTSILSILEFKSIDTSLTVAWENIMRDRELVEGFKVYSEGITDVLTEKSYYEYSSHIISYDKTESVSFLMKKDSGLYFLLSIHVNTENNFPREMKELLFCAKSLNFNH